MKKRYIAPEVIEVLLRTSGNIADGDDAWDGFVGVSNTLGDPNSPEMSKGGFTDFDDDLEDDDFMKW